MKKKMLDLLICPACLPEEIALRETIVNESDGDIIEGGLNCPSCNRIYPIRNGIADLDPRPVRSDSLAPNKYETPQVVSSYLWSHYADLFNDENASTAYRQWADLMEPHEGLAIDTGAAVGRFTFEMAQKCDFAIGIDNSRAFIATARELMRERTKTISLKEEGNITADVTFSIPPGWDSNKVEFIIADAMALPFPCNCAGSVSSLNLIDKVPGPMGHLAELNRAAAESDAQFLLSDPFSWSEEAAREDEWLGGLTSGPYAGRGLENITKLLGGNPGKLPPRWKISSNGHVWWKIRTHSNHFEQIRSCYVKARR